jgi:hypothetical protein
MFIKLKSCHHKYTIFYIQNLSGISLLLNLRVWKFYTSFCYVFCFQCSHILYRPMSSSKWWEWFLGGDLFTYIQNQELFVNPNMDRFVFILLWKWETLIVSSKNFFVLYEWWSTGLYAHMCAQVTWTRHSISDKPTTICPPRELSMQYHSLYSWYKMDWTIISSL